ncbi:MAG TPA: hypothetical protein VHB97_10190 [Polyangia bacterium]|nr:hypothetical protein [Polyangia bacterium]
MELKKISQAALPAALAKAERYRLLNEPEQAESICRDVLAVEPKNQTALVTLLLALTDQFRAHSTTAVRRAEDVLAEVADEYSRVYYAGIIRERWGLALLAGGDPGRQAFAWLDDAMKHYEAAEALAAGGNDDAILRWNSCARIIERERLHAADERETIDHGDAAPRR